MNGNADRDYRQSKKQFNEIVAEYDLLFSQPDNKDGLNNVLQKLEEQFVVLCEKVQTYRMEMFPQVPAAFERLDNDMNIAKDTYKRINDAHALYNNERGGSTPVVQSAAAPSAGDNSVIVPDHELVDTSHRSNESDNVVTQPA